ncbi:hypothetical protein DFA_02947 [Cavenderia fasciculata]|uniref:Uncharacterized protein n=1 Tax=Cavenderia fasciculata TaxID=261658 RepID=F4PG69_CACFS|nr:uncharacterized protein DFA_02947 [Cavenderia fasciculata]EGG24703.1 hypothetical protein DFA_02947 [Cavenderia fasciculata]|eukprot:XP_004362554.1 hypothetical protein DFA_02947 [Cavenderia fasciculata]
MHKTTERVLKMRDGDFGTTRSNGTFPLMISCQMWGSGKSYLGINFLKAALQNKIECSDEFRNLKYLLIDSSQFSKFTTNYDESVWVGSFQKAIMQAVSQLSKIVVPESTDFHDFCKREARGFFFHIDELEATYHSDYQMNPSKTITILSDFLWKPCVHLRKVVSSLLNGSWFIF